MTGMWHGDWRFERRDDGRAGFLRHVRACNNAVLPGERLPFRIGAAQVGWVKPDFAARLAAFPEIAAAADGVALTDAAALPAIARRLSDAGCYRWRREEFDIRAEPDGPVLARLDRGALPSFGVMAVGVHVNGLVRRPDGLHVWVARRAADKLLDPSKLDHIVAGGVPAGLTPAETLVKEAEEEAAIPASLARQGGSGRDDHLRDGAARGAASRPAALLRPGICRRILRRAPRTARWRRSSSGRSRA